MCVPAAVSLSVEAGKRLGPVTAAAAALRPSRGRPDEGSGRRSRGTPNRLPAGQQRPAGRRVPSPPPPRPWRGATSKKCPLCVVGRRRPRDGEGQRKGGCKATASTRSAVALPAPSGGTGHSPRPAAGGGSCDGRSGGGTWRCRRRGCRGRDSGGAAAASDARLRHAAATRRLAEAAAVTAAGWTASWRGSARTRAIGAPRPRRHRRAAAVAPGGGRLRPRRPRRHLRGAACKTRHDTWRIKRTREGQRLTGKVPPKTMGATTEGTRDVDGCDDGGKDREGSQEKRLSLELRLPLSIPPNSYYDARGTPKTGDRTKTQTQEVQIQGQSAAREPVEPETTWCYQM